MELYLKVAKSKAGVTYRALVAKKGEVERTLTFDMEAIMFVTNWGYFELKTAPEGMHKIKI